MRRAERVVFAFAALGEAGKPAALADTAHAVAAAGKDLVGIGLVADIPDQLVGGGVEHIMQRHRQFDHAQACAEMAAGHRDRVDQLLAQFARDIAQLFAVEFLQVVRRVDAVEQGMVFCACHHASRSSRNSGRPDNSGACTA